MQSHSVLIIEDDIEYARFIVSQLQEAGFTAETVATGTEMFHRLERHSYDCYIVDLNLPDEDGIVLIRRLRALSNAPVLVLSGRRGIDDKLASFDLGAEDYITKPVDPRELVMRLNAILKRIDDSGVTTDEVLYCGDFVLDHSRHEAHGNDGKYIGFSPSEFALIWTLTQADGMVMSREDLIDALPTLEGPVTSRAVDNLVSRVRRKLAKDAILTVPNAGYKCGWTVTHPT